MANDSLSAGANNAREAAAVIQWHPGFCSAVEFELRKNKDVLSFKREYKLTKGPLAADLLVIELLETVQIENEIGGIFRRHNILEFNLPDFPSPLFSGLRRCFPYKIMTVFPYSCPYRHL